MYKANNFIIAVNFFSLKIKFALFTKIDLSSY